MLGIRKNNIFVFIQSLIFIIFYLFIFNFYDDYTSGIELINMCLVFQFFLFLISRFIIDGVNNFFLNTYNTFFLIFTVFHLGIGISEFFGYTNDYFDQQLTKWYLSEYTFSSLKLIAIFNTTYILFGCFDLKINSIERNRSYNDLVFVINNNVLIFLSFFWIVVIYFVVGVKSYQELYVIDNNLFYYVFVYGTAVINISFLLMLLDPSKPKYPLIAFIIWGAAAFSIGVRGPVFYPVALATAILISQNRLRINYAKLFIVSILFLSLLSYKFLERNDLDVNSLFNPLSAVREMGGSLRPVYEVNLWVNEGLPLFYGETYLAPFDRMFNKIFSIKDQIPANMDERLMNVMIMNKAGPYGFSILAEAYINLKSLGVFIISIISVLFFKVLDIKIKRKSIGVFMLIFAYFFFYHIRQSFASAFGVTVFSLIYTFTLFFIVFIVNQKLTLKGLK